MSKLSQTMLAPAAVPTDGGSSSAGVASFADGAGLDFSPPPVGNIDDKTIVCAMQDKVSLPGQEKTGNSPSPPQKISSEQEHFEWEQYLEGLPAMELRKRFPKEASSHRNMLARGKKGFVIHSDFRTFRDFLRHMGKAPTASATVDRIDPDDPEYAPARSAGRTRPPRLRTRPTPMSSSIPIPGRHGRFRRSRSISTSPSRRFANAVRQGGPTTRSSTVSPPPRRTRLLPNRPPRRSRRTWTAVLARSTRNMSTSI